jgi:hypothetical protein
MNQYIFSLDEQRSTGDKGHLMPLDQIQEWKNSLLVVSRRVWSWLGPYVLIAEDGWSVAEIKSWGKVSDRRTD